MFTVLNEMYDFSWTTLNKISHWNSLREKNNTGSQTFKKCKYNVSYETNKQSNGKYLFYWQIALFSKFENTEIQSVFVYLICIIENADLGLPLTNPPPKVTFKVSLTFNCKIEARLIVW